MNVHDTTQRVGQEHGLASIAAERDRLLARMQMQFDRMPAACVVISADGCMMQVNAAFQSIFNYQLDDVNGRNLRDVIKDPAFCEQALDLLEGLRRAPENVAHGVYENVTARGQAIVCRWTATALRTEEGGVLGMIAMAENITEQIDAERALRASEGRYRALMDISPVGIFRADVAGQAVFVNERCALIMGIPRAQALGLGWLQCVHAEDVAALGAAWQRYIASAGTAVYALEFRMVRQQEQAVVWCLGQVTPERDADGNLTGHVGTITDITAMKLAQQALQEAHNHLEDRVRERTAELEHAKQAAERSDRVKTAFLTNMSHELRTPLNSIIGFTDVILEGYSGPLTEPQRRQLGIVRASSSHLRSLIDDVLDITRIEAGQVGLEFTQVDLRELAGRRLASFETEAARKGLALHLQAGQVLPLICSDSKRAGQIITNLISNAVKFTDVGSVTLEVAARDAGIEVVVADTGIGIPQDAIVGLFKPFNQVSHPDGRLYDGTGLGLAISRNLARALGGDVVAESRHGHGSRFKLWLPEKA